MRSPVADLLADLAVGLEAAGIAWYLFGARAAILHGVARLTADVDVTVRLPESASSGSLVTALERHGFRPRVIDADFIARTRVIPFVHAPTALPLDVVLAGPGLEDRFFELTPCSPRFARASCMARSGFRPGHARTGQAEPGPDDRSAV